MSDRRLHDDRVRAAIRELGGGPAPGPLPEWVDGSRAIASGARRAVLACVFAGVAAIVAASVIFVTTSVSRDDPTTTSEDDASSSVRIVTGGSLTLFSSTTAEDWVRNSEYVVVASVVDERATNTGDGDVVGRSVRLSVDEVVWTRPDADQPLTEQLELPTWGWVRSGGGDVPLASAGTPRLEVGHSYLLALVWMPRLCSEGDAQEPARWIPLGFDAVIPYDNSRIGYGESEGRDVAGDIDQSEPQSLERDYLGKTAIDVAESLRRQPSHARDDVFPTPTC